MAEQIGKNAARFSIEELSVALYGVEGVFYDSDRWKYLRGKIKPVVGVETDSRRIETGNLFVALRGEKFDGHSYLREVAKKGASVALVDNQFWKERNVKSHLPLIRGSDWDNSESLGMLARFHRQRFSIPLVAVTGSYGKTSTRALIHAALSQKFETLTSQANFNNEIGLPMTLFQLETSHEAAVLEMGMRGRGQIAYLAKIAEPTVGVITNIGPQHIEILKTVEEIAAAKAELLENLPEDGIAVLPADSPFLPFLQSKTPCKLVTFGAAVWSDTRVEKIETRADGNISCEINGHEIHLPLPGAHNAINAAAAFAVARELGVSAENIVAGLEKAELPGARMRVLKLENGITLIDDCYNAGPDSMRAALQTLLDFPGSGRRVAILGAMKELGEHAEAEHGYVGYLAGRFVEVLIGVGEETRVLLDSAETQEVEGPKTVSYCDDASEAAIRVGEWLKAGDIVLVKGSRSVGLEVVVEAVKGV